jgi:two-component system, NarL family, sensor histidine kinase DegS
VADPEPTAASSAGEDLAERVAGEVATLDRELTEIDLLVQQAKIEAERHEQKRSQAADKLANLPDATPAADSLALSTSLVSLTRRAVLMEAQVEVLEGKRKALGRFRESLAGVGDALSGGYTVGDAASGGQGSGDAAPNPGMSRIVLSAQEDMRREIARAMHDGPAQSLTNIVLQAQILERLLAKDPEMARTEVRHLVDMVQQTLDATKTFIFDVRPMVLDDLGLVPTLRRAARDRGRKASVPVEFESIGADRRLPAELESGLFRVVDEAITGYLTAAPDRVSVRLDWTDERVEARVSALRDRTAAVEEAEREAASHASRPASSKDLPPALAAMMQDRRDAAEAAAEVARNSTIVALPADAWREIQQRASSVGIATELTGGGGELRIGVDVPAGEAA